MTFSGYPVTVSEVAQKIQRWELKGSVGPDLVLYARSKGAKARFYASTPEDLLYYVDKQIPVIVQVNRGMGPLIKGHFMVVVGYHTEGIVANTGTIQQEIIPWSKFLTEWYSMGNFAVVIEPNPEGVVQPVDAREEPGALRGDVYQ
jgi:hypothetical protein